MVWGLGVSFPFQQLAEQQKPCGIFVILFCAFEPLRYEGPKYGAKANGYGCESGYKASFRLGLFFGRNRLVENLDDGTLFCLVELGHFELFCQQLIQGFVIFEVAHFADVVESGFGGFAGGDGSCFDFRELRTEAGDFLLYFDVVGVSAGCEGAHGAELDFFHGYLGAEGGNGLHERLSLGIEFYEACLFLRLLQRYFSIAQLLFRPEKLLFIKQPALRRFSDGKDFGKFLQFANIGVSQSGSQFRVAVFYADRNQTIFSGNDIGGLDQLLAGFGYGFFFVHLLQLEPPDEVVADGAAFEHADVKVVRVFEPERGSGHAAEGAELAGKHRRRAGLLLLGRQDFGFGGIGDWYGEGEEVCYYAGYDWGGKDAFFVTGQHNGKIEQTDFVFCEFVGLYWTVR